MNHDTNPRKVVIACQGGGSHAAYAAGALKRWLPLIERSSGRDAIALRGLSGTSGGALSALLAWYGLLQGGAASACARLDQFWQSNCAQTLGEQMWNGATIAAATALPFEISFSPRNWPLREGLVALTSIWPTVADALGAFNPWGRGEYFQLAPLIARQVDFKLVGALGALLGIANDIRRWREADVQLGLKKPLDPIRNEALKRQLEQRIRTNAAQQPRVIRQQMGTDFGDASLLRSVMADWPDGLQDDQAPFLALEAALKQAAGRIPHLMIGAVNVGNGEFVAFSSERAPGDDGISLVAVLASAAIPWIFEAVSVPRETPDGKMVERSFWDGLFSQNPPVKISWRVRRAIASPTRSGCCKLIRATSTWKNSDSASPTVATSCPATCRCTRKSPSSRRSTNASRAAAAVSISVSRSIAFSSNAPPSKRRRR